MMYATMKVQPWSAIKLESSLPIESAIGPMVTDGCIGFIPVFDSDESARKFDPDGRIVLLHTESPTLKEKTE